MAIGGVALGAIVTVLVVYCLIRRSTGNSKLLNAVSPDFSTGLCGTLLTEASDRHGDRRNRLWPIDSLIGPLFASHSRLCLNNLPQYGKVEKTHTHG
jgi:hypothetical protein